MRHLDPKLLTSLFWRWAGAGRKRKIERPREQNNNCRIRERERLSKDRIRDYPDIFNNITALPQFWRWAGAGRLAVPWAGAAPPLHLLLPPHRSLTSANPAYYSVTSLGRNLYVSSLIVVLTSLTVAVEFVMELLRGLGFVRCPGNTKCRERNYWNAVSY